MIDKLGALRSLKYSLGLKSPAGLHGCKNSRKRRICPLTDSTFLNLCGTSGFSYEPTFELHAKRGYAKFLLPTDYSCSLTTHARHSVQTASRLLRGIHHSGLSVHLLNNTNIELVCGKIYLVRLVDCRS